MSKVVVGWYELGGLREVFWSGFVAYEGDVQVLSVRDGVAAVEGLSVDAGVGTTVNFEGGASG